MVNSGKISAAEAARLFLQWMAIRLQMRYKLVESGRFEIRERVFLIFVMSAQGPAIIRNINRFNVLQTIRLHDNQISRSELSEMTGLSQATISSIVGHLIEEGALIEDDARGVADPSGSGSAAS